MKIWNLSCDTECIFAVVYADTLKEAIEKVKKASNNSSGEWTGEEWTEKTYNGVLIFS